MIDSINSELSDITQRIVTNGHWASIYLGWFEGCNRFHQKNNDRLDADAGEFLYVLDRGLPRLAALCLCRLWDKPQRKNNDLHSLPSLIKLDDFMAIAKERDSSFVMNCNALSDGDCIEKLRRFRIVDLAHNLPFDIGGGFTLDELREVLLRTQHLLDRLVKILRCESPVQDGGFQVRKNTAECFWQTVSSKVLLPKVHS